MTTVTSNSITGITTLTATTDVANKQYVDDKGGIASPPSQTGNAGKFLLTTDGTNLSWDYVSNYQEFASTGIQTFTVPSYSNILLIEAVGAGAGGDPGTTRWSPTSGDPLFPNLWYDASDATSVTLSGSTVSTWANKGSLGSTYNLTPLSAQANRQPAYTATQNGLRIMTFDGADDQMVTTQLNNVTHIFVASAWSAAGAASLNYKGFLSSNNYDWHGDANLALVSNSYAASWVKNQPTESTSQLDGSNFVNITNNKWTTFSVYSINLQSGYTGGFSGSGTANGDGRQFQGDYGEILVYQNTRLTTDQINFITGYLAWKWGSQSLLPVSHPYKNAASGVGDPNYPLSGKGGASGSYTSWFIPKSIVTSNITVNPGVGGAGAASSTAFGSAGAGTTISWTGPGGTYTLTANGGGSSSAGTAQTVTQSSFYYTTAGLSGGSNSAAGPGLIGVGNTATAQTNQFQPTGGGSGAASTTGTVGGPGGSINIYGITTSASGGDTSGSNGVIGFAYTGLPYGSGGGGGGTGISTAGNGGNGARGGGGGGGGSNGSTLGIGGNGGDGYVKITWW